MCFLNEYVNSIEKRNTIWDKVGADIKIEFDCEPVYSKEILKPKIKSHGNEITDFYDKKFLRWALVILVFCSQERRKLLNTLRKM